MLVKAIFDNVREAERKFQEEIETLEFVLKCKLVGFYEDSEPILEEYCLIKDPDFEDLLDLIANLILKEAELQERFSRLPETFMSIDPNWEDNSFIQWAILGAIWDDVDDYDNEWFWDNYMMAETHSQIREVFRKLIEDVGKHREKKFKKLKSKVGARRVLNES